MRRAVGIVGSIFAFTATIAVAGTITIDQGANFDFTGFSGSNEDGSTPESLDVATVQTVLSFDTDTDASVVSSSWVRDPWTTVATDYLVHLDMATSAQVYPVDTTLRWADPCLRFTADTDFDGLTDSYSAGFEAISYDSDGAGTMSTMNMLITGGANLKTAIGSGSDFNYAAKATVPTGSLIDIPAEFGDAEEVRLLTTGARTSAGDYTVVLTSDAGSTETLTIPIETLATTARNTSGAGFFTFGWTGWTPFSSTTGAARNPTCSNAAENGGDLIAIVNPWLDPADGTKLASVAVTYTPLDPSNVATAHLPGPLAVALELSEADYLAAYDFETTVESASTVGGAVGNAINVTTSAATVTASPVVTGPGIHSYFYDIAWNATFPDDTSDIFLSYACGDESAGTITFGAYQSLPASGAVASGAGLRDRSTAGVGSVALGTNACSGDYIRVKVELFSAYDVGPALNSLSLEYDEDYDMDGFTGQGLFDVSTMTASSTSNAARVDCNENDSSTGGQTLTYPDVDGDSYGDSSAAASYVCDMTNRSVNALDCADSAGSGGIAAAAINPDATEQAGNAVDENCDGSIDCFQDLDGDGYGTTTTTTLLTSVSTTCSVSGASTVSTDCQDVSAVDSVAAASINPGAVEVVGNNVDENCDSDLHCYLDADGDGFGTEVAPTSDPSTYTVLSNAANQGSGSCAQELLFAANTNTDCNDAVFAVKPSATEEVGNGVDEDCDGFVHCYMDADGDGYGSSALVYNAASAGTFTALTASNGTGSCDVRTAQAADDNTDCFDTGSTDGVAAGSINPGAVEVVGNDVDENCDSDLHCYLDADGDGFGTEVAPTSDPSTYTVLSNAANQGSGSCAQELLFAANTNTDCNDAVFAVKPSATEEVGNGVDEDCDGFVHCYMDADGDGYGSSALVYNAASAGTFTALTASNGTGSCDVSTAQAADDNTDCFDTGSTDGVAAASINPGAVEVVGNNVDENCDSDLHCYLDADGDGFGTEVAPTSDPSTYTVLSNAANQGSGSCAQELLFAANTNTDCNDAVFAVKPSATEEVGNGVDEDCDGFVHCYMDADGDGYGSSALVYNAASAGTFTALTASNGTGSCDVRTAQAADDNTDCFDTGSTDGVAAGSINPGAVEVVGNDVDENCDSDLHCYLDADGDGFGTEVAPTSDPSTYTVLSNEANQGSGSCAQELLFAANTNTDCNDAVFAIKPSATEEVGNAVDEDCDDQVLCYLDADGDGFGSAAYDSANATTYMLRPASDSIGVCNDASNNAADDALDCADAAGVGSYTAVEINPSATEAVGNDVDENCDGVLHCYVDADADGYGSATLASAYDGGDSSTYTSVSATNGAEGSCAQPSSFAAAVAGDCLDVGDWDGIGAAAIRPGLTEVYGNGADEDCSGTFTCYVDTDGDSYGVSIELTDSATFVEGVPGVDADCAALTNGAAVDGDCDDNAAPTIYPGASEANGSGIDSDCSGSVVCYTDVDGDGYGVDVTVVEGVAAGGGNAGFCLAAGHAALNTDCNDTNDANGQSINPGSSQETTLLASGVADGVDYNCDGFASCFTDVDADGFGSTSTVSLAASALGGTVSCDDSGNNRANDNEDCNDVNTTQGQNTFPGSSYEATVMATGTADGVDYDCDGDAPCFSDVDGDGYGAAEVVVTEASPGVALGLGETAACDQLTGTVFAGTDCNDQDTSRGQLTYPTSTQESVALAGGLADGIDYNCDGLAPCFADADGDFYGDPAVTVSVATTSLGAEISCNEQSLGRADDDDDCDDTKPTFYPGAQETTGTGEDNNCDAVVTCYKDYDGDSYGGEHTVTSDSVSASLTPGTVYACTNLPNGADNNQDCMDCEVYDGATACLTLGVAASLSPDSTFVEVIGNLYDEDCDGRIACYPDLDNDGYGDEATDPADDSTWSLTVANSSVEPYNNGVGTCNDYRSSTSDDCHDTGAGSELANPDGVEDPGNGYDDDCDGEVECYADGDADGFGESATVVTIWGGTSQSTPGETGSFERVLGGTYACSSARNEASKQYEGLTLVFDCNDDNAEVYPGNTNESTGTSIDNNCDGTINCFVDADGDGWGGSASPLELASVGASAGYDLSQGTTSFCIEQYGFAEQEGDCHDNFKDAHPGITTGEVFGHTANEGDLVVVPGEGLREVGTGSGQYDLCGDGSDTCYGVAFDDDCDGTFGCYLDEDGDGWGTAETTDPVVEGADPATYTETCIQPTGTESARRAALGSADPSDPAYDCHPDVAAANPGVASDGEIVGNAYDDNCDGVVACYTDIDDDGYGTDVNKTIEFSGDPATANAGGPVAEYDTATQTFDCDLGYHMASRGGAVGSADYDCHDNYRFAHPGGTSLYAGGVELVGHTPAEGETHTLPDGTTGVVGTGSGQIDLCGDGRTDCYDRAFDEDCDGVSRCYVDADGDAIGGSLDDGTWGGILPGATLPWDQSGSTIDAYAVFTCETTSSSAVDTNRRSKWGGSVGETYHDCHDQNAAVYPTQPDGTATAEVAGHQANPSIPTDSFAFDENCDGIVECFEDLDQDGYGTRNVEVTLSSNALLDASTTANHLQYNCELSPSQVRTQYTTRGGTRDSSYYDASDYDCHDNNANANPGVAAEVAGTTEEPLNGGFAAFDEDCDGVFACYRDRDNDGYGTESADLQRTWYVDQIGRTPVANGSDVDDGMYSCELEVADLAWGTGVEQTPVTGRGGTGSADFDCHDYNFNANPGYGGVDPDGNSTALIPTDATALAYTTVTTNAYDDDCDGVVACYRNVDGDQYGTFVVSFDSDNGDLVDDADELPLVTGETYYACDDAVRQLAGVGGLGTDDFDCHDDNASVFPTKTTSTYGDQGLTEVSGNAYDDDCDGSLNCYEDLDNDGYGTDLLSFTYSAFAEYPSPDYVGDEGYTASEVGLTLYFCGPEAATNAGVTVDTALREQLGFDTDRITDVGGASNPDQYDCHDDWEYAHPGVAAEIPGDPFDNDCDGTVSCYVDRDGDGFGAKDSAPVATPSAYDYDAFPFTTAFGEFSAYPVAFVTGLEDYQSAAMEVERAARQDAITGSWYDCRVAGDSGDAGFAAVGGETTDYYDCHDDVASVYPALIAADERSEASGPDDATCDGPIFCQTYNTDGDIVLSDISVGECTGGTWRCFADSGQTFDNGETAGDAYDNDCDGFVFCFDNQDGDQVGTIAVLDGGDDQVATSYDEGVYSCTGTNEARYTGDCHDEPGVQGPTIYPDTTGAVAGDDLGAAARAALADASYPEATDYRDENCDVVMCYDFATASVLGEGQDSVCSSDDNRKLICITGEVAGDSYDQDCDGAVPCLYDFDGDGFGGGVDVDGTLMPIYTQDNGVRTATTGAVSQDGGLYSCAEPDANEATDNALGLDCNDAAGGENENPGGTEGDLSSYNADAALFELALAAMGDTIDQDCDGQLSCFADADGDGYGAGFAFDDATGPTALADFAVNVVEVTLDKSVYADCDRPVVGDDEPAATSSVRGDCHDDAAEAFPGADSVPGNDLDNNCDRVFTCFQDLDGDGYGSAVEINDDGVSWSDVALWSDGRPDACLDEGEADDSQDCLDDITLIQVLDDDLTDGVAEPETVTINTVDWNRARMTNIEASYDGVYFGEIYGDGIDGDCDGVELCFVDADEDGFVGGASGSVSADILGRFGALVEVSDTDGDGIVNCDEPLTTVATALWPYGIEVDLSTLQDPFAGFFDCNDDNDTINPNAVEVWYNNVDENCDNKSDFDRDGDGYDSREYTEDRAACPEAYINASFLDRARLDVNAALAVGAYDPVIGCGRGSDCNDTPNEGEEIYPTFNEEFADQENLAGDYMAQSADADLALPSTLYGLTLDEDVDADIGTTLTLGVKGDPEACEGGGDNAQVDNDCDGSVNTSRDCWFEVDAWAADLAEYKDLQVNQQLSYGFLSKEHYTACAQDYESGLYFVDRSDPLDFSTLNKDVEECDRLPTLSSGDVAWAGENDDDIFDFCWNPNWTSPNNSQGRYYRDGDGDLEGDDSQQAVYLCAPALEQEGLWISNRDDCDDLAAETNARGVELCDNTDNNCNDEIDEPTLDLTKALDPGCEYHYIDADADSWGLVVADATAPVAETDVYCICPSHELWDTTDDGVLEEQAEPETCPHYLVSTEEVEDGTIATDLVQYGHVIGGTCYVKNSKDCNDLDQLVKPFAPGEERYEQIDGVDNDCNFRMPLIELDCDDDNAFPFLPSMSEALLANPSEVPIASAADVGLETCDPNVSPPSVLCWGEQLPLACDSGTGFWTVSTIALESYGVFEGASRIPRKVDYNCSSWDCDDQCANRCEGADEACDGIDNDCNDWLEEFNQADLDGVPDPMASGEVMPGRVNEDELDLDQDNHIACNGVVSSNQNATTMRSCRSYSNFGDCNDLCMPSSPASEAEVCNGFLQPDACVDGEPADGDRDGYGVCGTFGVGDVVDEDLYVMVLAKGDLDAYVEDPETDDPPQIVPLIPPRVYTGQAWETEDNWGTVRECDVPLHTALEELTGELPVLVNDAVGMSEEGIQAWYGETRDAMLDVCVQADTCRVLQAELEASSGAAQDNDTEGDLIDPTDVFPAPPLTGDSELPSYCDDLLDVTCSVVKLRLDALGDEAMYSDASWDPDGCVYPEDDDPDVVNRTGGLYHPEQAITRSVWSQEQIVEARKLVVDFECYRLFGTYGCANGVYTSETTRGTWNSEYELAGTGTSGFFDLPELPSRLLESDTRWWLYLNRYQPSSVTGGTLAGCWGDPRPIDTDRPVDSLENISLTGGDCAEDNVLANRGMTEGPEDLLALYLGTPTSCDTCLDKIDNNCNGLIDAAEPACARCFVSQGYGCAGCSGTASSSTFGTTPTWVPLVLGMLLLGIRRREQS